MSELAPHASEYGVVEGEPPELAVSNLNTGVHLWASATAFFFGSFLFAYFYLRSFNNGDMWHPRHVAPSVALGTIYMACLVGSAVLLRLAAADERADRGAEWRRKAALALALVVVAVGIQIAGWATQNFGPSSGGYASVYVGWTGLLWLFVLGTAYWLETVLATGIRYRALARGELPPAGHASGDTGRMGHDIADPLALLGPQLGGVAFYMAFLSGVAVLTWIVLYLV